MTTEVPASLTPFEAHRLARDRAERRWRFMRGMPKYCAFMVLGSLAFMALLPLFRLGDSAKLISFGLALFCVVTLVVMSRLHKAAFMEAQKLRGVNEGVAERNYAYERPFAT